MSKSIKKRNNFNDVVVEKVAKKFGYTKQYIRASLRGDRVGEMPDQIIKEYKRLDKQVSQALQTALNS